MFFDASARVAPEKQDMPACLPMVSLSGDERATMTEQELQREITEMWAGLRASGQMVVDAPSLKVGMPYPSPYEGVCFHAEVNGVLSHISIPVVQVERFAQALIQMVPYSIALEQEADADIGAHEAITKAKG